MIRSKHMNTVTAVVLALAVLITSVLLCSPASFTTSASAGSSFAYETQVFDKTQITSVNILVDEDEWNTMLENATSETYICCDVEVNGTLFSSVGIRPKGNTSLSQVASDDTTDRYSFKIEFDHYIDGQTCFGLDKLVLNNMISDNTYMKEYLSYDMLSYMGIPTSLYAYASISLNGESWGLYLALEGMEESFAERNFGSSYGSLYKPESDSIGGFGQKEMPDMTQMEQDGIMPQLPDFNGSNDQEGTENQTEPPEVPDQQQTPTEESTTTESQITQKGFGDMGGGMNSQKSGSDLVYTDDDPDSYTDIFENAVFPANESDYDRVITALENLNNGTELEKYIDVEEVLKYFAVNTVLVNLDSYASNMKHNYYLYEQDGQLSMLPWDYNLAFAGFQSGDASSAINFPIDTPVSGSSLTDSPMLGKLLEVEEYQELYHSYLQDLMENYFDNGTFTSTISMLRTLIDSQVAADPTAFCTYEEYDEAVSTLKTFGLLRAESINGQLNGTIPSTSDGQAADSSALIDASSINLTTMGSQGGGGGGGDKMAMGGRGNPFSTQDSQTTTDDSGAAPDAAADSDTLEDAKASFREDFMKNMPEGMEFPADMADMAKGMGQTSPSISLEQLAVPAAGLILFSSATVFIIKFNRKRGMVRCKKAKHTP